MFVIPVLVFIIPSVASCEEPRCNKTSSVPNARLLGLAFLVQDAQNLGECIDICNKQTQCRSVNFDWANFLCELNKADVHIAPQNLMTAKGYVYLDTPWPKFHLAETWKIVTKKVCQFFYAKADILSEKNPYFGKHLFAKQEPITRARLRGQDFATGGGWTLVVSISSSSWDHLLNREVNCYSPTRCVEFTSSQIPGRKLSDESIHEISTYEGTFRVDKVTAGFSAFYQIPAGARYFDSECRRFSCPRIIVSHVYPYHWESNCKGILNGYRIHPSGCHRVFDMHDDSECGSRWDSSKFATNRVMYAYACGSSYGIADNAAGFLFVK